MVRFYIIFLCAFHLACQNKGNSSPISNTDNLDQRISTSNSHNNSLSNKKLNRSLDTILLLSFKVLDKQSLSSILSPYKGVTYTKILKLAEMDFSEVNFNNIQVGQKYDVILNSLDSTLISYTHFFSDELAYKVQFEPELSVIISDQLRTTSNILISSDKTNGTKVNTDRNTKDNTKNKSEISQDFLTGRINYSNDPRFVLLDKVYHTKSSMYLEKETAQAFIKMHLAAKQDGIDLLVVSGARNFSSQKSIWERKFIKNEKSGLSPFQNAKKILLYSSMPSTSRHHWGTDIDINNLESSYFKTGQGKLEYDWLVNNADKFGFCQVYSKFSEGSRSHGYQEEPWHWSYMPKSTLFLDQYNSLIDYSDIKGFKGSELSSDLKMQEHYVNGISRDCKN